MNVGRRAKPVIVAAGAALSVAGLGALSTDLGPWYRSLVQPAWKPPDVLFGPVWTTIYALAAIAGVRAWRRASGPAREWLIALFAFNAFVNVMWSLLFFRLRRPDWALAEVAILWLSIAVLIAVLARHSRLSAALLVPYLAWVTFAGVLNAAVVRLNGPFGGA
jgi:tryptophan-rich sensory protein